jgi:hypothetical protein
MNKAPRDQQQQVTSRVGRAAPLKLSIKDQQCSTEAIQMRLNANLIESLMRVE